MDRHTINRRSIKKNCGSKLLLPSSRRGSKTNFVVAALFALRVLMEKYREGQKELHCVFVDLEKALL